ncbi:hypothetical protein [Salinibacterium sp. SWN248]|nr:hypothetical protein [Salinibacterium sp. SWN248]MBH0023719.1 hypothetical protein [Salinibacterium sp. SWN248]
MLCTIGPALVAYRAFMISSIDSVILPAAGVRRTTIYKFAVDDSRAA